MDALELSDADRRLRLFERQGFDDLVFALVAATGAVAATRIDIRLAVAAASGAVVAVAFAAVAAARRRGLIARLALDRDAYVLDDVREYGRRLTAQPQRDRLARRFGALAGEPDSLGSCFERTRVRAFAPELSVIAEELRDHDATIEPTSIAECQRLLTDGAASPLLNPLVPLVDLRATLIRIENGVHEAAGFPHPDQESR